MDANDLVVSLVTALNGRDDVALLSSKNLSNAGLTAPEISLFEKYEPENVLVVYGTLAPGRSNHKEVAHLKGRWERGRIRGTIHQTGWGLHEGYPAFRPGPSVDDRDIEAFVLFSKDLEGHWPALDEFEGEQYKRVLVVYELLSGERGVGFVYAANDL